MADSKTTILKTAPREAGSSRASRRLRREGQVPGVLYGGEGEAVVFSVDARDLRNALRASGAVIDLSLGGESSPAVLKEAQRHPVRGEVTHVDFVRVNLKVAIEAVVPLVLIGAEDSPGVRDGGVVDQPIHEVRVEALPNEIPESIEISVAELNIGETAPLSGALVPAGVTMLDDPDLVVVSVHAPRVEVEPETIEQETELIGEDGEPIEGASQESGGDEGDGGGSDKASDGDSE